MISFSAVIPTRGRHQYLRQAIDSVLVQSLPAKDIIVVDDGKGAHDAVGHMSQNIIVLDNRERGPVAARNLGVASSTSDCIAFLDDDDWWTDCNYLAAAAAAFEAGSDFCYANGTLVFDDGRPNLDFAFHADADTLARDNTILISAVTYRRELHSALGDFDQSLPFYGDWDWYLRVARSGHALVHLQRPAVAIRVHPQNMSGESLVHQRRANLDLLAAKHGLTAIPLKNHLDIAQRSPGVSPP